MLIIVTTITTNKIEGREIKNVSGVVQVSSVRSRSVGRDITAMFKILAGGGNYLNILSY